MVQKRDALPDATSLRKDINKLFEHLAQIDSAEPGIDLGEWFPRVDVLETIKSVVVNVEAPGFGIDDLDVVDEALKAALVDHGKIFRIAETPARIVGRSSSSQTAGTAVT